MKLFRFMCAAALTASVVGTGIGALSPAPEPAPAVAASTTADGKSVRIPAESTERCKKPGDTEWSAPASSCPKALV
ncbi:hypothetical protein [Streptomyces sp. NPDC058861]|uniref:hypothetical protein n=1 Tax=Streptomyces sp. NPDC058861 TaxID=3346653 RepID=UPI0036C98CAD